MNNVFAPARKAGTTNQPWVATLGVGKTIFDYYDSQGDKTLSADTVVPSLLDGPMVVRRYNNLTLNASTGNVTLTTQNRCRGLMLLIDGNLTLQRSGSYAASISMTARGARGHAGMGLYDMLIPDSIVLQGQGFPRTEVLKKLRTEGWAICDRWLWDEWGKIAGVKATAWTGGTVLLSASGCGAGAPGAGVTGTGSVAAVTGIAGVNGAPGGGGKGYIQANAGVCIIGRSGAARPWGGGAGTAGIHSGIGGVVPDADDYGGPGSSATGNAGGGGGAGNPGGYPIPAGVAGGDGTGGVLIIVCKGNIIVNAGCIIQSDGMSGGNATGGSGGGGSGGGHVSVIYGGTHTNNGTGRANGGAGGTGMYAGGSGGAGSVVTKTFAQMGWA